MRVAKTGGLIWSGLSQKCITALAGQWQKAPVPGGAGRRTRTPPRRAPAWLPALVTTGPRGGGGGGGERGTSPGLGGCSEGTVTRAFPGGLKRTTCVTSSCYFGLYAPKLCEFGFLVN